MKISILDDYFDTLGTLDDTRWLTPTMHIWTDSKQPWVIVPEGVESHGKQPA